MLLTTSEKTLTRYNILLYIEKFILSRKLLSFIH